MQFIKGLLKVALWLAAILLLVGAVLKLTYVVRVPLRHNGMAPTLTYGEEALLWRSDEFDMGDVIVCKHPGPPDRHVMGRVVGKPGMTIKTVRGQQLWVEGTKADYDILREVRFHDRSRGHTERMIYGIEKLGETEHQFFRTKGRRFHMRAREVHEGLFLLSDNRTYPGEDSRVFGTVDPSECVGEVFMRLRPSDEEGADLGHGWLDWIE